MQNNPDTPWQLLLFWCSRKQAVQATILQSPAAALSHNLFPFYRMFWLNMLQIWIRYFSPYQQDQRQRQGGRERKRVSAWAQERKKHRCLEPGTKEERAPILEHSVVVTETSQMTKASVYQRARLRLCFAPGRKQTDSQVPAITCNQTRAPSLPEAERAGARCHRNQCEQRMACKSDMCISSTMGSRFNYG